MAFWVAGNGAAAACGSALSASLQDRQRGQRSDLLHVCLVLELVVQAVAIALEASLVRLEAAEYGLQALELPVGPPQVLELTLKELVANRQALEF